MKLGRILELEGGRRVDWQDQGPVNEVDRHLPGSGHRDVDGSEKTLLQSGSALRS